MAHDGLHQLQAQLPPRAYPRIALLVRGPKGAVPSEGLVEVLPIGVEDVRVREDRRVAVRHGVDVLVHGTRRQGELLAAHRHLRLRLQHVGRAGHRRVHAQRLPDVSLGALPVLCHHLLARPELAPLDVLRGALRRDLALQERAHGLDGGTGASDASEADGEHDLVAELRHVRALELRGEAVVHPNEDILELVLLDEAHGLDPQGLHLPDADVEKEAVNEAREDPELRVRPPTRQHGGLLLRDPLTEHHEEHAPAHSLLNSGDVAEVSELRRLPVLAQLRRQRGQPAAVGLQVAVQEHLVEQAADGRPLRLRPARQKDEQLCRVEVRNAGPYRAEGRHPLLVRLEDALAIRVGPAPGALAMPPPSALSEGLPLPHEERQATPAIREQRDQQAHHVAPPCPRHEARPAREHRAQCGGVAPGSRKLARPDGEDDHGRLVDAADDGLDQVD
mmetsp:Transcript_66130/g.190834  ORF Transcript_66130/g.190834 Transcript_66130/m.190834 type:complete len:448 (-) Transcript_66130:175-1518(-)